MSTSLDIDVRAALQARKGDWQAIATGSGVSYSWLSKFVNGHIDNPGFGTLMKLHDYLTANPASEPAAPAAIEVDKQAA